MIKIGPLIINTNVFLASLSGCSDLAFRLIAREHGAGFCFQEMSDSNSLVYAGTKKNDDLHQEHPQDVPIAAQLMGSDPKIMLKGAQKILEQNSNISFLDINAACPMKKIIKKKAGAHLIADPQRLYSIIDELVAGLPIPITIKLRIGYAEKNIDQLIQLVKNCEEHGIKAIFVHGRTMEQIYHGEVDHESIKAIKDNVKISVIASGNIFSPQRAKEMMDLTGCDGVVVARGAFGNPWIFNQISHYLKTGELLAPPTLEEKLNVAIRHLQYIEKYKLLPERTKVGFSRKVAIWYLKSFKNAASLRCQIGLAKSFPELYKLIEDLLEAKDW